MKLIFDKHLFQSYAGIKICLINSSDTLKKQQDYDYIVQAMELVKSADFRRFQRIQRRLVYVVDGFCSGSGEYNHPLKACYVDLERFDFANDEDWFLLQLACTLVHEATHGEIASHNIKYGDDNFVKIERICHQEEMRFLSRIVPNTAIEDFDKAWWEIERKKKAWQRAAYLVSRLRGSTP